MHTNSEMFCWTEQGLDISFQGEKVTGHSSQMISEMWNLMIILEQSLNEKNIYKSN